MKNLITALLKARSQFKPIRKDRTNPFFKSKYADLDSVIAATESALTANGLLISQTTGINEGTPVLITTLWHESGENLGGEYPLPKSEDPQKLGAAITYARRYALCAILGVTADDDNNGNSNSNTPKTTNASPKSNGTISREEYLRRQQMQKNYDSSGALVNHPQDFEGA